MSSEYLELKRNLTASKNAGCLAFGDISREWAPGGVAIYADIETPKTVEDIFYGDIRRTWAIGGIKFYGNIIATKAVNGWRYGDINRIWIPGGLAIKANVTTSKTIAVMRLGDIFKIVFVTLAPANDRFAILLTVDQPYGIPWMQKEVVHSAWCWKIMRLDGMVLGFTSHDEDITYNGVLYKAETGFAPTAVSTSGDMTVDNLDAQGMLKDESLTAADLRKGLYNNATIEVFLMNYRNLKDEVFILRRGYLGEVTYGKNGFTAEIRGLMEAYQQQAGKVCQKTCRTHLGSQQCGIYIPNWTVGGTVTTIKEDGSFITDVRMADDYFSYGVITWTEGDNAGSKMEVKKYEATGRVQLFLPMSNNVGLGDAFSITAGCDGNATTCKNRFNNLSNFRGEPYVIGNSYAASYPVNSANNIVSLGEDARMGTYKWD